MTWLGRHQEVSGLKRPYHLPSPSGIPFTGATYCELPSLIGVAKQVDTFLQSTVGSREATIAVVLGEWGEGKTELYNKKIQPAGEAVGFSFFVPASSVANGYDLPRMKRLLTNEGNESIRFLAVLLDAIRTTRQNRVERFPDPSDADSAESYVTDTLSKIATSGPKSRCIVFVDEFEELVNQPEKARLIIQGMKELVNGMYPPVHKDGQFPGLLHLVLACTPAAYYKLSRDRDLEQVFGGFSRRVSRIELVVPRPVELVNFVEQTLRWSWDGDLPSPHPFRSSGVHETLAYVSRGNLGALVQLMSKVLSDPHLESLDCFDGHAILSILETHFFSVLGAEAPAIEANLYREVLRTLSGQLKGMRSRQCVAVFETLSGEQTPHTIEDLRQAHPDLFSTPYDVKTAVDLVNQGLQRTFKIDHSVAKLRKLPTGTTAPDVIKKLVSSVGAKVTTDRSEGEIFTLDGYKERYEVLEDTLQHCIFTSLGEATVEVFFPEDEQSVLALFTGVSNDTAREMIHAVLPRGETTELYYGLANTLRTQLFPSPVPRGLEFITSPEERLKLWRRVGRDLEALAERHLPDVIPVLMGKLRQWEVVAVDTDRASGRELWEVSKAGTKTLMAVSTFTHNPGKPEIRCLMDILRRRDRPAHLALLLYAGDLLDEARTSLEASGLGPEDGFQILPVQITVGLLRRLVAVAEAVRTLPPEALDENGLIGTVTDLFSEELQLTQKYDQWIKAQETNGLVISGLKDSIGNLGRQVESLRFFLNFPDGPRTPPELWTANQDQLVALQFYGEKVSLVPDMELPEFQKICEDLAENKFVRADSSGYHVVVHPAEARLRGLLEDGEAHSLGQLSEHFVDGTGAEAVGNVFLRILIDKGLASTKGKNVQKVVPQGEFKRCRERYSELKQSVVSSTVAFDTHGMLFVRKKRGTRLIPYTAWVMLLDGVETDLCKPNFTDESRGPRVRLFGELLDKYEEKVLDLVRQSYRQSDSIIRDLTSSLNEFTHTVKSSLGEVQRGRERSDTLVLAEGKEIAQDCDGAFKLFDKSVSKMSAEEWSALVAEVGEDHFSFGVDAPAEADFFNPKLAVIRRRAESLKQRMSAVLGHLEDVVKELKRVAEGERRSSLQLRSIDVPNRLPISARVRVALLSRASPTLPTSTSSTKIVDVRISDVKTMVEECTNRRDRDLESLRESVSLLKRLQKSEERALGAVQTLEQLLELIKQRLGDTFDPKTVAGSATAIKRFYGKSETYVRRVGSEARSPDLRRIEVLANDATNNFDIVANEAEGFVSKLRSNVQAASQECEAQASVLKTMADSVINMGDQEWVLTRARELERMARELPDPNSSFSLEEFRQKLTLAEEGTYERVGANLGNNEVHAKALKIAIRETSARETVPFYHLRKIIMDECKVSATEANEALDYLFAKRYLEPFVKRSIKRL
jgi:hypothetical protein